jgi:hypothetical protein
MQELDVMAARVGDDDEGRWALALDIELHPTDAPHWQVQNRPPCPLYEEVAIHPVRPGELAADHPVPLVLGGELLPARPDVLCASCKRSQGVESAAAVTQTADGRRVVEHRLVGDRSRAQEVRS